MSDTRPLFDRIRNPPFRATAENIAKLAEERGQKGAKTLGDIIRMTAEQNEYEGKTDET